MTQLALTLSLNDRLVGPLQRALKEIEKGVGEINRELKGMEAASTSADKAMTGMRGPRELARQTQEAARNVERMATWAERFQSAFNKAQQFVRPITAAAGAVQAASMVAGPSLRNARGFEFQLAGLANTAYSSLSPAERISKVGNLSETIRKSVLEGGGTKEEGLAALQKLIGSGQVNIGTAERMLPEIMKASTASGAAADQIAQIVVSMLSNGFKEADIPEAIGKAIAAGQAGGFEMKDMAQWLPKLLAAGTMSGLRGMKDFERILAMAQVSVLTAGGSAEAGNNALNFLLKINSADTAADAKKYGVDLAGTLAKARSQGISSDEALMLLVQRTADADPRLRKLKAEALSLPEGDAKRANLESQAQILKGSAIGKWLQDRQALMPVLAMQNNPETFQRVLSEIRAGGAKTTQGNFDVMKSTSEFRVNQGNQAKEFALMSGLRPVNEALGKLGVTTADLYTKFPLLGSAVETGKLAINTLAASAAAASGALLLLGGGKAAAAVGAGSLLAGAGGAAAAGAALKGGGAGLLAMGGAGLVAGVGVAGAAGYGAGALINKGVEGTRVGDAIGATVANILAFLGNDTARQAVENKAKYDAINANLLALAQRPVQVVVDGRVVAETTQAVQARDARRQ